MTKFEKDKVVLLKTLRDLVDENIDYADVRDGDDLEAAEFIMELKDKRRVRRLKKIGRALDKLISDTVAEEKLREEDRKLSETKLKNTNEAYVAHCNADQ